MPSEQGYDSQLGPREATPRPMQSPQGLGAAIGAAAQQAGGMVHEQQLRAYQQERKQIANAELARASRLFTEHRLAMGDQVRNLRETAGPGGDGHVKAVDEVNQQGRSRILSGISDPTVAAHFTSQFDDYSADLHSNEASWEQGKRIDRLVTDTAEDNDQVSNIIRGSGGDTEVYRKELGRRYEAIQMMEIDDDTKQKLMHDAEDKAGVGLLLGMIDKDPNAAIAAIDEGAFNHLPPDTLEQLRNGGEVELRRRAAAAEHEAALMRAQAGDAIGVLEKKFKDGIPIADEDFVAAIDLAEKMGDKKKAEDLRGMRADNKFAQTWTGQTPLARQNRVAALQAKGNKRTDDESRELKWLTEKRDTLDKKYDGDPVAYAMETAPAGGGPPPVDIRTPQGLTGRIDWVRRNGPAYGRGQMPLFTEVEADGFARRKGEGQEGLTEVLNFLDQIPDEGMRKRAAQQIDPNDRVFHQLTLLKPKARHSVLYGAQALRANPNMLIPDKEHPQVAQWIGGQTGAFNAATKYMAPADRAAMQNVAMMFLAGQLSGTNTSINRANPEMLRIGFVVAAGGTIRNGVQYGGFMNYKDGQTFLAPPNLTFDQFVKAGGDDMKARGVYPVNLDGSVAALRYAHPVFIGIDPQDPGVWLYQWETKGGNVIQGNKGGNFVSRIRNQR